MEKGYSFIYNESEIIMKEGLQIRAFTYDITFNLYIEAKERKELDKNFTDLNLIKILHGSLYMR
jgi:hypothetical protein